MKTLLSLGAATLAVVGVVGASTMTVSALGGQQNGERAQSGPQDGSGRGYGKQTALETRAQMLDMTAEQLQTALETKTMSEIAAENGIDEATFRSNMAEAAKDRWQQRGLSDEEVSKRVAEREERQAANGDCEYGSGNGEPRNYRANRT